MTPEEQAELERLRAVCRDLEYRKGITDTVHHDRLRQLEARASAEEAAPHPPFTEEVTDDTHS